MKSKFRIMDIFIIALCIVSLLIFANKINLADGRTNVFENEVEAEIKIIVPFLEEEIADNIKVGAPFKDVLQFTTLGTIANVEVNEIDDEDFVFDEKPLDFDKDLYKKVTITVKASGKRTEKGILIGQTNYLVGQSNTFSAGIVMLEEIRISGIEYIGE